MSIYGLNDLYGGGELQATGSAMIEAHEREHNLGDWRSIDERMRLAGCRLCGLLVWIVRPSGEETWRVGGNALETDCERGLGTGEERQ